ncbi:unnamed protein product [Pleuronectes platessa]|uniref:Uncharacterized protein n=1 Tax=Pleuronectes platessa TaxID=8262 RepID=A0A9N7Z0J6_PLEPL|nr:unnamed protein product [Pleuronectes platessa]
MARVMTAINYGNHGVKQQLRQVAAETWERADNSNTKQQRVGVGLVWRGGQPLASEPVDLIAGPNRQRHNSEGKMKIPGLLPWTSPLGATSEPSSFCAGRALVCGCRVTMEKEKKTEKKC